MRIEKIRLDEVKKTYGDIKALEDISLSLYQGSCFVLQGSAEAANPCWRISSAAGRQKAGKDVCGRQTGCIYIHQPGPDCRNFLCAV
ncbi:hypothetical protein [Enterocloster sp.]|uniref:hypothetical protein n=1 Tax=Enterocloster sp. TaxID=2719315 RepID=UPI0039A13D25